MERISPKAKIKRIAASVGVEDKPSPTYRQSPTVRLTSGAPGAMGRKKGVPNKTTRIIKEAAIIAAEEVGEDGKGMDGLVGYLRKCAKTERKAYLGFLGRCMPIQVTGKNDGPVQVFHFDPSVLKDAPEDQLAVLIALMSGQSKKDQVEPPADPSKYEQTINLKANPA